jgi:hypothetical protein
MWERLVLPAIIGVFVACLVFLFQDCTQRTDTRLRADYLRTCAMYRPLQECRDNARILFCDAPEDAP